MKQFRKIIFWCHLSAGVTCGVVILIMSVTGALLAFRSQITAFAERDARTVRPPEGKARRLNAEDLFLKVLEVKPGTILTGLLQAEPSAAASITTQCPGISPVGETLYVNPYTSEVLEGSKAVQAFFRLLIDWHRWLGAEGGNRSAGRVITGICNAAFLVLAITGPYLWWPKMMVSFFG